MINCPRCNSQVPDGTSSCPSCGYQFTETNVSNSQQGYNAEQSSPGGCQQTNFTPYGNNASHQQPTRTPYTQSGENYPQQAAGPQYQQPQPNYGPQVYPSYPVPTEDKANVGLCILSVFFPIFGIIYYFCTKSKKPKEAKGCLKAGLISAGVNFLLCIIIMIVAIFGAKSIINTVMEETDNSDIYYEENYEDEDISFDFDLGEDNSTENSEVISSSDLQSNSNSSFSEDTAVSSDWKKYTFSLSGKTLKLPISVSDFTSQTGYDFKSTDDANSTLKGGYYNILTMQKGDNKVQVTIFNEGKEMKTQKECTICGISAYLGVKNDLLFPGGLKLGMEFSKETLIETFGTPDRDHSDENYYSATYYEDYDTYYSEHDFEVTIYDGKISDIGIRCIGS